MVNPNIIFATKFIRQALSVHGRKYDYSLVQNREVLGRGVPNFLNIDAPILIGCSIHGEFMVTPREHLKGKGCHDCHLDKNLDSIKHALRVNDIIYEKDFVFPHSSWHYKYDLYLPEYDAIIQFHSLDHDEPLLEHGGVENLKLIKEADLFRDALARQMRVKIIYITSRHLKELTLDQLGKYIKHLLNVHKHGIDYRDK